MSIMWSFRLQKAVSGFMYQLNMVTKESNDLQTTYKRQMQFQKAAGGLHQLTPETKERIYSSP